MGIMLDKGTAADTTVYVDRALFDQITSYTSNNSECQWSELGVDGEKRWVVVNGQRFECPLSEAEKEAFKRASLTLLDVLDEYEKEKLPSQRKENKKIEIDFNKDKFSVSDESNSKISNLVNNKKVMNMPRDISKYSGNKIHLSF